MAFSWTQVMPLAAGDTSSKMSPSTRGAGAAPSIRPPRMPGMASAALANNFLRVKRLCMVRFLWINCACREPFGDERFPFVRQYSSGPGDGHGSDRGRRGLFGRLAGSGERTHTLGDMELHDALIVAFMEEEREVRVSQVFFSRANTMLARRPG